MLGLLLSPGPDRPRDRRPRRWSPVCVLTVVARPLSVLVSTVVAADAARELSFISWAGLRGAVPIVLTTIPLAEGVDDADELFDIVFVMVVVYTAAHRPDAAVGRAAAAGRATLRAARPRRGGRAARPGGGRPAPGDDRAHVEDARRRGRRAAAAPGGLGVAGDPAGQGAGAGAAYGPAPRRRPAGRDPAQAARGHRGAAAPGLGGRAARAVARGPHAARATTGASATR